MPTAETTLIPASGFRAAKRSLTSDARLDNEPNLRLRHSIEFIDENGGRLHEGLGIAAESLIKGRRKRQPNALKCADGVLPD